MTMDAEKKAKIQKYINDNEPTQGFGELAAGVIEDLTGLKEETESGQENGPEKGFLKKWLRNDESLLAYAKIIMEDQDKKENNESNFFELAKKGLLATQKYLLELKLSITCPYFADFKEFLEELKRGSNTPMTSINKPTTDTKTQTTETGNTTATSTKATSIKTTPTKSTLESSEIETHTFCGININNIKSESYQKSSSVGVTWCSKTTRNNGLNFGIILPSGDPYDAGQNPGKDCLGTLPKNGIYGRPENNWNTIEYLEFISGSKGNFADLYLETNSDYGFRACAFKDDKGQWYVLDPYTRVNGKLDNSPKKLEDYIGKRKIIKAHFYESKGYAPDNQETAKNSQVENAIQWAIDIAEDNCHGYERGGKGKNGQYDCSGLVTSAFKGAGFDVPISGTATMRKNFTKAGFKWISPYDSSKLQRGDITLKDIGPDGKRHTEIYIGNGKFVGARSNKDGRAGDSSGNEISISNTGLNRNWDGILRYTG